MRRTVGIPDTHYRALYHPLFDQFAVWSQEFPASEAHHHCAPSGSLQHGIEVALHAVKRRRKLLLPSRPMRRTAAPDGSGRGVSNPRPCWMKRRCWLAWPMWI
ncbi:TraI domain-containing protein [Thiolapillus sp.]|uniref:TraI domain-containing protein n=1 Tax=Thiolapillus sp. TaxID=2017437 RepID=UPI003AF7E6E2